MGMVEDLERLNKLKDNGVITEAEFESEKQRLLSYNSQTKARKNKSKIFFIITGICVLLTIVSVCLFFNWYNIEQDAYWGENGYYGYNFARLQYDDYTINRAEFKEIEKEYNSIEKTRDFFGGSMFVVGGIAIISLITGIILKIKEKGGIKIVD